MDAHLQVGPCCMPSDFRASITACNYTIKQNTMRKAGQLAVAS